VRRSFWSHHRRRSLALGERLAGIGTCERLFLLFHTACRFCLPGADQRRIFAPHWKVSGKGGLGSRVTRPTIRR